MKQIIVMVAMIALGVAIAGFVMGFGESAETLANASMAEITYENIIGE
ncbi:MAG: hypothetical protein QM289_00080 [Bacillota bacterium]|jgi:flagellar basal body-associated protein FliL|nr:hypothetical protein [Bacillota bacterium]NLM07489.1 hypothetical protein [Clostridiales Family XIII bacterium]HOA42295.1 hypothetical protein [Bacillota bacterium]HPZ58994.1 hypothetical protein [Bacillota bacterium]HQC83039.1 hypothetical protein [Bacillota bacterium]